MAARAAPAAAGQRRTLNRSGSREEHQQSQGTLHGARRWCGTKGEGDA